MGGVLPPMRPEFGQHYHRPCRALHYRHPPTRSAMQWSVSGTPSVQKTETSPMSQHHSMFCPCCGIQQRGLDRRGFIRLGGAAAATLALTPHLAQAQTIPSIAYDSIANPVHLPRDVYFGECSGVALNSRGHIFVLSRGNTTGPAYAAAAAQLLEFAPNGRFVRARSVTTFTPGHLLIASRSIAKTISGSPIKARTW